MSNYLPVVLRQQVRRHFRERCAYCQTREALTASIFEIDHIMPLAVGGETQFANLCLACPACNRYKGIHQQALDPLTSKPVSLFHPQRDNWSDHFAWSPDGIAVQGLTACGRATVATLRMNRDQMVRVRRMWVAMGEHPPTQG